MLGTRTRSGLPGIGMNQGLAVGLTSGQYNGGLHGQYHGSMALDDINKAGLTKEYLLILFRARQLGASLPSPVWQLIHNQVIISLKNTGDWSLLSYLYVAIGDGDNIFARINWISPFKFTLIEGQFTPTPFITKQGFDFNAANFFKTGWVASLHGPPNYTQNNACLFEWILTPADNNYNDLGSGKAFVNSSGFTNAGVTYRLNDLSSTNNPNIVNLDTSVGFTSIVRVSSANKSIYKNGVLMVTDAVASSTLDTFENYIGGENLNGSISGVTGRRVALSGAGSGNMNQTNLFNIFDTLLNRLDYFYTWGDSFTVGLNSSDPSLSYVGLLASGRNTFVNNKAVSSKGIWNMISVANTQVNAAYGPNNKIKTSVLVGFNDVRSGGNTAKLQNRILGGYRSFAVNAFKKFQIAAGSGDSSIVRTGTWAGFDARTVGGKYTTGALSGKFAVSSNTLNDTIAFTFTDTNVAVGLIGNSGDIETYGIIDILIDGVVQISTDLNTWSDNITVGLYDCRRVPIAFFFTGLSNSTHTITVKITTAGITPVDYFAIMDNPQNCKKVLFCEIPYMNATGYAQAPANGSIAAADGASAKISQVVTEFAGWPIVYVPINTGPYAFNLTTDVSPDNIHPNDLGHFHIYQSISAML